MILTKAYIISTPSEGDNKFRVRVPLMEDNTSNESEFEALLCCDPSSYNGYNVGDCVYVDFEDNKYNDCVIIGKLFIEPPEATTSYVVANELKVTGSASLPSSTKIGDQTAEDIVNLYNATLSGGSGNLDETELAKHLKKYVKWVNTERSGAEYYANKVRCMTGEEYDTLWDPTTPGYDADEQSNTLYFLTTPPPSEESKQ